MLNPNCSRGVVILVCAASVADSNNTAKIGSRGTLRVINVSPLRGFPAHIKSELEPHLGLEPAKRPYKIIGIWPCQPKMSKKGIATKGTKGRKNKIGFCALCA